MLTQKHGERLKSFKYFRQLNPEARGHFLHMRAISAIVALLRTADNDTLDSSLTIYVPHSVELMLNFHHTTTLLME